MEEPVDSHQPYNCHVECPIQNSFDHHRLALVSYTDDTGHADQGHKYDCTYSMGSTHSIHHPLASNNISSEPFNAPIVAKCVVDITLNEIIDQTN